MLQSVKADLTGILTLFADYRPQLDPDSLALDIRKLERQESRDYLFLARREKSYLFPVEDIYLAESYLFPVEDIYLAENYANLCWTAYLDFPGPRVDALYLHISRTIHGHPFGLATVLDYAASARDVEQFAARTRRETAAHVRWIIRHYRTHARIGSTLDFISSLQESR